MCKAPAVVEGEHLKKGEGGQHALLPEGEEHDALHAEELEQRPHRGQLHTGGLVQ